MLSIILFLLILFYILIMTVYLRISPFITLISASFLYGLCEGMEPGALLLSISTGSARIFQVLGVMIFSGVCIAHLLRKSGFIDRIVSDISCHNDNPAYSAGLGGFILSLPLMCCNTAFVLIAPIIERSVEKGKAAPLLYTAAVASIVSFVLIYPSPAVVPVVSTLLSDLANPYTLNLVTIPVSLLMLGLILLFSRKLGRSGYYGRNECGMDIPAWRAWAPVITPLILVAVGLLYPPLHVLSTISVALFGGLLVAMAVVPASARETGVHDGTKYAGLIMFDLCGAGAFGAVIAAGSFPADAFSLSSGFLPAVMLPFALAFAIQAASGSRVVSASTTAAILAGSSAFIEVKPEALILMIAGGSCMISFVSDPYFWLIKWFTGDETMGVIRGYTIPLAGIGFCIGIIGCLYQML